MAEAVLDAFCSGRPAAIEAGTGVGKSVAYLVPAIAFSQVERGWAHLEAAAERARELVQTLEPSIMALSQQA